MNNKLSRVIPGETRIVLAILKAALDVATYILLFGMVFESWPISQARWFVWLKSSLTGSFNNIAIWNNSKKFDLFLKKF